MNITHKEITIIVILFLLFFAYFYYTNSIETFSQQSNKPLEDTYKNIISNLYTNIEAELDILDNSSDVMNSLCNNIKNNNYNLKKISENTNFKTNLNKLIQNDEELTNISVNMVNNFKLHDDKEEIFDIIKNIYMDKSELYKLFEESNKQLLETINSMSNLNWDSSNVTFENEDFSSVELNQHARELFDNINNEITDVIEIIDDTNFFDTEFKEMFKEVYINLKNLNKNLHIRYDTFNLFQVIKSLMNLYETNQSFTLSNNFKKTHNDAINEYKTNMRDLINEDIKNIRDILQKKPNNVLSDQVEVDYLNAADTNTNIVYNFCNKIKKLDKPNENSQMFLRFSKEFVDKKNKHIKRLQKEIDTIQNQLYEEEINDFNTNKLRIEDQASKQYEAIMKARENIENSKKFKLNIS